MADGFVCRGLLSTTIRTLFKEAIKCVHLGNDCYPGFLRILISVDAFITNTFLLLYVHFHMTRYFQNSICQINERRLKIFVAALIHKRNNSHFVLAYKTYHQNTLILAENLDPLPRGLNIHYNTERLEGLPKLETGK